MAVNISLDDDLNRKHCWVCFATEDDDRVAQWVRPCLCRGTTKWVHQLCLQRWIDEKQKGNINTAVKCPQCNAEYLIVFPNAGPFVFLLEKVDTMISQACPFVAAGIVVGSVYWSAVTYGAVTIMQTCGSKEGLDIMEKADPLFLLVGLPTIPIVLVIAKMVRWEDYVIRAWRRHWRKLWFLTYMFPVWESEDSNSREPVVPTDPNDYSSATRILCGALILPTVASICGRMIFKSLDNNLQRTIMGGIAFVAIKGVLKIYYKQNQFKRLAERTVLDYTVHDSSSNESPAAPASQSSMS